MPVTDRVMTRLNDLALKMRWFDRREAATLKRVLKYTGYSTVLIRPVLGTTTYPPFAGIPEANAACLAGA